MLYRRRWGTGTWHWCQNCSSWPAPLESEERTAKPTSGELCNECACRAGQGTCDDGATIKSG